MVRLRNEPQGPVAGFRLSPQQEHLWRQLAAGDLPARSSTLVGLEGALDGEALRTALTAVVQDHEILRTRYEQPTAGMPAVMVIEQKMPPEIVEHDLGSRAASVRADLLDRLLGDAAERDRSYAQGVEATLVRLSRHRHRLRIGVPALATDLTGLDNLVAALCRRYAAQRSREALEAPSLQYADVAEWLAGLAESPDAAPGRAFWRSAAAARRPQPRSAWLESPPAGETSLTRPVRGSLGARRVSEIERLAAGHGCSIEDFLLACWSVLLGRLSGGEPSEVAVLCDGRSFAELQELPGLLARYLPLTPSPAGRRSCAEALRDTRDALARIRPWQESFSPASELPSMAFDYLDAPRHRAAAGVSFAVLGRSWRLERSSLLLRCLRDPQDQRLELHAEPGSVSRQSADRTLERYLALVDRVLERPERLVGEIDVLTSAERRRLVADFNDTRHELPAAGTVVDRIEEQAERRPEGVAVRAPADTIRYGELSRRAARLGAHLRSRGVKRGVLVGICVERSVDMVVAVLAVLKAGGAFVPLDPSYPADRLGFMLSDADAAHVVTRRALAGRLPGTAELVCVDEPLPHTADALAASTARPEDLAYLIYTSGSTGLPKGVLVNHRGLLLSNLARADWYRESPERFLLLSPFSFDSSMVGIFWTLCAGGCLELVDESLQKDPAQLAEQIRQRRVSHLVTLPTFWGAILDLAGPGRLDLLRTVIVAGEPCPGRVVDLHRRLLPETRLCSEYGATETTIFSSVYDTRRQQAPIAPLGVPIAGASMYVVDRGLGPVPIGVPGEVCFGGPQISPGYWNRPALTAERFVPDPFGGEPGARLFRSGDLARHLESGDLEFLGRADNQVNIRGFRVEPEEIEVALAAHRSVAAAAVVAYSPDGEATGRRLVAYLEPAADGPAPASELREHLRESLPEHMVPTRFEILDRLPRTPSGKLDRHALPTPSSRPPTAGRQGAGAITDPTQRLLAGIWADVLGLDSVGVDENFFELGGDSILSIQIVSRARQEGLALTPLLVFEHQTIAELATRLEAAGETVAEQGMITGELPPTPVQRWFCDLDVPRRSHWNMPLLLELPREIPTGILGAAARALLTHHDALRSRLSRHGKLWRLRLAGAVGDVPVDVEPLADVPREELRRALEERARPYQRALDLETGPLTRMLVFTRGRGERPLLLWIAHHLAVDVVSWQVLREDLETAIGQLAGGREVRLPPKTTSFKHWAEALERRARSPELGAELKLWRRRLDAAPARVPRDHREPAGGNVEGSLAAVRTELSRAATEILVRGIPRVCGGQISDGLLAAVAQAAIEWVGGDSLRVEVEGHGRDEELEDGIDLSRTVGWFTSFHPVVLQRPAGDDPFDAVRSVREAFREVPGRGMGYGLLRYLRQDSAELEELRRRPPADIVFNYMGRFSRTPSGSGEIRLAGDSFDFAYDRDPEARRGHVLESSAFILDGRLHLSWAYSENLHRRSTIEKLVEAQAAWLRGLARRLDAAVAEPAAAEFGWDRADVEAISAAIERTRGPA